MLFFERGFERALGRIGGICAGASVPGEGVAERNMGAAAALQLGAVQGVDTGDVAETFFTGEGAGRGGAGGVFGGVQGGEVGGERFFPCADVCDYQRVRCADYPAVERDAAEDVCADRGVCGAYTGAADCGQRARCIGVAGRGPSGV